MPTTLATTIELTRNATIHISNSLIGNEQRQVNNYVSEYPTTGFHSKLKGFKVPDKNCKVLTKTILVEAWLELFQAVIGNNARLSTDEKTTFLPSICTDDAKSLIELRNQFFRQIGIQTMFELVGRYVNLKYVVSSFIREL